MSRYSYGSIFENGRHMLIVKTKYVSLHVGWKILKKDTMNDVWKFRNEWVNKVSTVLSKDLIAPI